MNYSRITRNIEVTVTPEEVATAFANMPSDHQRRFFNQVAKEVAMWDHGMGGWAMQMEYVLSGATPEVILTDTARRVMEIIGEYAREEA